jgi:hypothetical protein
MKQKQPHGPPMTLGNMRRLGVQRLVAHCLNDTCRHQGLIDVSKFPDDTEVPSFARKVVCARRAWPTHRRAAELERATGTVEPDREGVALTGSDSQTRRLVERLAAHRWQRRQIDDGVAARNFLIACRARLDSLAHVDLGYVIGISGEVHFVARKFRLSAEAGTGFRKQAFH